MSKIVKGVQEALAIARGEIPAARIHHQGHAYVPEAECDEAADEITRLRAEVERKDAALLVARDCIEESFSHAKNPDDMLMAEARLRDIDAALTPSQEPRT